MCLYYYWASDIATKTEIGCSGRVDKVASRLISCTAVSWARVQLPDTDKVDHRCRFGKLQVEDVEDYTGKAWHRNSDVIL